MATFMPNSDVFILVGVCSYSPEKRPHDIQFSIFDFGFLPYPIFVDHLKLSQTLPLTEGKSEGKSLLPKVGCQ